MREHSVGKGSIWLNLLSVILVALRPHRGDSGAGRALSNVEVTGVFCESNGDIEGFVGIFVLILQSSACLVH